MGLLVPHMVRGITGPDNRRLIPVSLLAGALLLLCADTVTRALLPSEIPIGVLTALIGGPFFLLYLPETSDPGKGGLTMPFSLNAVTFRYGSKRAVDRISLDFKPGRFYGIVGPNGSGKTTVVDLLTGHRRPSSGTLAYRGRALSAYSKKALAREIALVPQNFYINFPFTAQEVVMMGRYPHLPRFVRPSATDLETVHRIMAATETEKFRGRFITQLSGGERQRVVFARALAQDTPVLILDEGTSSLDIRHALDLLDLAAAGVRDRGRTVIAVLQDINLAAAYCDRLVFLNNGRIAAFGETDTVLNAETVRSVFGVEAKIYYDPFAGSHRVVYRSGTPGEAAL